MVYNADTYLKETAPSPEQVAWWSPNIDNKITPKVRHTLETYGKIQPSEVSKHVYDIRKKAWAIRAYPCTGFALFLSPSITLRKDYPHLLDILRSSTSTTILDIGCYMGTDLRRLYFDGVNASQLYGVDLVNHWDLGFELFQDADGEFAKNSTFVESDLLHPSQDQDGLQGKIDIVNAIHVFHNWDWDVQVAACVRITELLKARKGSMFIGAHVGTFSQDETEWISRTGVKEGYVPHSVQSFTQMWKEVGEKTGTEWVVDATMKGWTEYEITEEQAKYLGDEKGILEFTVTRV